jgi:acyl-coenzyme A thioesterase PaaI-like protein
VPYSGVMGATVVEFGHGIAEVRLRERRKLRNHLSSVHAAALANLGELATGLAVVSALPPGTRGIVTELRIVFYKKARGLLTCRCSTELPPLGHGRVEHEARAEIHDQAGDVVAGVTAVWLLGADPGGPRA